MKDINNFCPACMADRGGVKICPKCGFDESTYDAPPHHLRPGTLLNGKYLVGKAIGEGGFGITYVGYELNLEIKLAIKEYFPNGFASRDVSGTDTVTVFSGTGQDMFIQGRDKFINEAKTLAKFDNLPGIVSVKDFFMENGTAYIVMEYVEGETLKDFLKRNGGKTPPENIFAMMQPLMKSLIEVHNQGLIHRDISPDNIMITADSKVKLLDFGAARDISADGQKSLSIQLKPGYAPEEQYRSHGKQGPWTDIYALCATMYRAITGTQPVEALERMQRDTLVRPSALGVQIDPIKEAALMRGMEIVASNRFQNVSELYNALYNGQYTPIPAGQTSTAAPNVSQTFNNAYGTQTQTPYNTVQYNNTMQYQKKKSLLPFVIAGIGAAAAILIALVIFFFVMNYTSSEPEEAAAEPTPTVTAAPTPPPAPVFTGVEASSTRDTDMTSGSPVEYFPVYAIDGNPATAWSADRNISLKPTLTLTAETRQHVTGIRMSNGYFKSEQTYTRNRRITKVMVEYEGGQKTQEFGIDQFGIMQDIRFDAPVDTTYISIHVLETYYGDWEDICISEVQVY